MVYTRQMCTSSGSVGHHSSPTTDANTRPTVVASSGPSTRQTQATQVVPNGPPTINSTAISTIASVGQAMNVITTASGSTPSTPEPLKLLDLPVELLTIIFSFLSYKRIGQIRLVSRKVNEICTQILNSTFSKLIAQTHNRFTEIKAKMPRRESARRTHSLAGECDIIETCYMRLSLLQMTVGKHIERGHCCFFPASILDEVYSIMQYVKNTHYLDPSYRVTDELFDLSTMAMEYFRDCIEPKLPNIGYFNKDFLELPAANLSANDLMDEMTRSTRSSRSSSCPSPPQSNMVLRKGIRKIKQGMKMYNNQLSVLRSELRTCKRKSAEQGKQIADQQKLLADNQKQTLEYANRLDENDKKNEEMARKFSTLLQELNKCRTELQYWRSKSPAVQSCLSCGEKISPTLSPEDYQAFINENDNSIEDEDEDMQINSGHECEHNSVDKNLFSATGGGISGAGGGDLAGSDAPTSSTSVRVPTRFLKRQHTSSNTVTSNQQIIHNSNEIVPTNLQLKAENVGETINGDREASSPDVNYTTNEKQCGNSNGNTLRTVSVHYNPPTTIGGPAKDLSNSEALAATSDTAGNGNNIAAAGSDSGSNASASGGEGGIGAVPAKTFYSSHNHRGVIVSPASAKALTNATLNTTATANTNTTVGACCSDHQYSDEGCDSSAAGVENVGSLQAIANSNETKKARRVQKATRCINAGGKRNK